MKPTQEQQAALDAYLTGESLRIEALAGTGKTTTLRMLVGAGSPRGGRLLYTSFGTKVVADAKKSFPRQCKVATNHALAWGVGRRFQAAGRLRNRLTAQDLLTHFGWNDGRFSPFVDAWAGAFGVIQTLERFCQGSDARLLDGYAMPSAARLVKGVAALTGPCAAVLAEAAREVWSEVSRADSRLCVTHDMYLKLWALSEPRIAATTIMLDEAQDANGVMVEVLRAQENVQLVIVGDRRQAIYGWRGAVDAMDAFDIAHSTSLTRSFRFGEQIAEVANAVLRDQCASTLQLQGDRAQPGHVGPADLPHCFIARTNATLAGRLFEIKQAAPGYRIGVVGGVSDLVKLVEGADRLMGGRPAQHVELAEFSHWDDVLDAVKHESYSHLRTLARLVGTYGPLPLLEALHSVSGNEGDPDGCDVLLSTAHKAKGAEFDSVRLEDDFAPKGPPGDPGRWGWTPEEGNLLYVACTRARRHLDPTMCEAVSGSWGGRPWPEGPPPDANAVDAPAEADPRQPGQLALALVLEEDHPDIPGAIIRAERIANDVEIAIDLGGTRLFQAAGRVVQLLHDDGVTAVIQLGRAALPVPSRTAKIIEEWGR
jgi:hypothetical protein